MTINHFIINDIKPLNLTDLISDAQLLFQELTYSHVPIKSENGDYLGCLSETDVYVFNGKQKVSDYSYALHGFFVRSSTNWLDVLEAFAQNSTNIMPVLDKDNNYVGYYELSDIIGVFNETPFFSESGGILMIEKGLNDYSMSEISQIVESNNGKLLGAFISKIESDVVEITLKIGNAQINDVLQSFRRYSYTIVSGHEEDSFMQNLKDRSKYLNRDT